MGRTTAFDDTTGTSRYITDQLTGICRPKDNAESSDYCIEEIKDEYLTSKYGSSGKDEIFKKRRGGNTMKTIQDHLCVIDIEKLIDVYLCNRSFKVYELAQMEQTGKEIASRMKENLRRYITRLQTLTPEPSSDGRTGIMLAYKIVENGFEKTTSGLIILQELMDAGEDGDISTYAYNFTRQEEIIGFLVSNAEFTQKKTYEVLADVLHEASYFGYAQEYLEEELRKLNEAVAEGEQADPKTYHTIDEVMESLGLEPEEQDEQADELRHKVLQAEWEFAKYWRKKELKDLKKRIEDGTQKEV